MFAETYTDEYFGEAYDYPENADEWLDEILALPEDANYMHWVSGFHPDGRGVIGYRVGRYIIHQAAKISGKNILELSRLSPDEILEIVASRSY